MIAPTNTQAAGQALTKVPQVSLLFWIVKIAATTLGETGGDALSMSMSLGYLASTAIFATVFAIAVAAQMRTRRFQPWLYWTTIIATTTVGTTMADYFDRSLGVGYAGGTTILLAEQNMHFCLHIATHVAIIDKGRIAYSNTSAALRAFSSASRHCICCSRNCAGMAVLSSARSGTPCNSHR